MTWYSMIVSIGPILQGAMKVPMTFLEVLSNALTVKGGVMVFMLKPMAKAVVKGQTFNTDPLLISTMGTLAPMHSGDLQSSSMGSSVGRGIFIGKGKERM